MPGEDTTKPETTLVSPTTEGPFTALNLQVDASDEDGLARVVANVYHDGTLVKSTQTAGNGATSVSHTATVDLPEGTYKVRYNSQDLAGNTSATREQTVVIDKTAPTAAVKTGPGETVGADGLYSKVSFKLFDAGKVDKVVLNGGVEKDLSNNTWSDLNFVEPGAFGAVLGTNALVVYDVAGNSSTTEFTLVAPAPAVPAWESTKVYNTGDEVSHDGKTYRALWWTSGDAPNADNANGGMGRVRHEPPRARQHGRRPRSSIPPTS